MMPPVLARNAFAEPGDPHRAPAAAAAAAAAAATGHADDIDGDRVARAIAPAESSVRGERTSDESTDVSRDIAPAASPPTPPRGHANDSGSDNEAPERYPMHDTSDSLISSDATMDRGHVVVGAPASRSRIEEEPEFEISESREESGARGHSTAERVEDEGEDEQGSDDQDSDDGSRASSTRHLRDDELEMLILQKHLGFRGSFAPGARIGAFDVSKTEEEEEAESGFGSENEDEIDADESPDAFGSRPARDPARERKRKGTGGQPRRVVFHVDKRRKQWLSEAEDRALRRGPVMGLSLQEFTHGRSLPRR